MSYFNPSGQPVLMTILTELHDKPDFSKMPIQSLGEKIDYRGYFSGAWVVEAAKLVVKNDSMVQLTPNAPLLMYNIKQAKTEHQSILYRAIHYVHHYKGLFVNNIEKRPNQLSDFNRFVLHTVSSVLGVLSILSAMLLDVDEKKPGRINVDNLGPEVALGIYIAGSLLLAIGFITGPEHNKRPVSQYTDNVKPAIPPLIEGQFISQSNLTSQLVTLDKNVYRGVCYGTVHALIEAALIDDYNGFEGALARFYRYQYYFSSLKHLSTTEFTHFINTPLDPKDIKTTVQFWLGSDAVVNSDTEEIIKNISIEIKQVCERVIAYQTHQRSRPDSMAIVTHFSGVYDEKELDSYLNIIQDTFLDINYPIPIYLSNIAHATGFIYFKNNFYWIDSNQAGVTVKCSLETLSNKIIHALSTEYGTTRNQLLVMATTIYSNNENLPHLQQKIKTYENTDDFKRIHAITPQKATTMTSLGASWMLHALKNEQWNTVKALRRVRAEHKHLIKEKSISYDFILPKKYNLITPYKKNAVLSIYSDIFEGFKAKVIKKDFEGQGASYLKDVLCLTLNSQMFHFCMITQDQSMYEHIHNLMIISCLDIYINRKWSPIAAKKWIEFSVPINIQKILDALKHSDEDSSHTVQNIFEIVRQANLERPQYSLFSYDTTESELFKIISENEPFYQMNHPKDTVPFFIQNTTTDVSWVKTNASSDITYESVNKNALINKVSITTDTIKLSGEDCFRTYFLLTKSDNLLKKHIDNIGIDAEGVVVLIRDINAKNHDEATTIIESIFNLVDKFSTDSSSTDFISVVPELYQKLIELDILDSPDSPPSSLGMG